MSTETKSNGTSTNRVGLILPTKSADEPVVTPMAPTDSDRVAKLQARLDRTERYIVRLMEVASKQQAGFIDRVLMMPLSFYQRESDLAWCIKENGVERVLPGQDD